jgi:uncharacterized DUF497 family protein
MTDAMNAEYEWSEDKRQTVMTEHRLDMIIVGPLVLADPDVIIVPDNRKDYGEDRFQAYGTVDGKHVCLCFTPRGDKIRLITVFKVKDKIWRKYHEEG